MHKTSGAYIPTKRRCEKIKAAHAESQKHKEAQSGTPFFALQPLRTLRLGVKPVCLPMN
jgi:hypothetical protein